MKNETSVNITLYHVLSSQDFISLLLKLTILKISGQEIRMALWGSKATQFSLPEDSDTEDTPILILFTGCLVKNSFGIPLSGLY